jgi:heptaprenyl diphosphate synthase
MTGYFSGNHVSYVPELKLVERKLLSVLQNEYGPTFDLCSYLLHAGGKRIRPLLTILSGKVFGAGNEELITAAASIELIHMASLVHDDVIDESHIRRGRPSLNGLWGNHLAVLAGDYLFAKAFQLLVEGRLFTILDLIVEAIAVMCSGEIDQALDGFASEQDEIRYLNRIYKKTGKLIAASCTAGALLGNATGDNLSCMENYGGCLGLTYQIVDDLLDLTGTGESLGKPTGLDFRQGNYTLPLLRLIQNDSSHELGIMEILKEKNSPLEAESIIQQALLRSDALDYTYLRAREYAEAAKRNLDFLPSSPFKLIMLGLADFALHRLH